MRLSISLASSLFFLVLSPPAHAGEDYYLLMFASQRIPNNPNYAHTFATFVRATWEGDGCTAPLKLDHQNAILINTGRGASRCEA